MTLAELINLWEDLAATNKNEWLLDDSRRLQESLNTFYRDGHFGENSTLKKGWIVKKDGKFICQCCKKHTAFSKHGGWRNHVLPQPTRDNKVVCRFDNVDATNTPVCEVVVKKVEAPVVMANTTEQASLITTEEAIVRLGELLSSRQLNIPTKDPNGSGNKGYRGQELERQLGLKLTNTLIDFQDGELKTYTIGEQCHVTMLKRCLPEIMAGRPFDHTRVGKKLKKVLYIGFDKKNNYVRHTIVNNNQSCDHYMKIVEDYNHLAGILEHHINNRLALPDQSVIDSPNNLLTIRPHAAINKTGPLKGEYTPLTYNGVKLFKQYLGFYINTKLLE